MEFVGAEVAEDVQLEAVGMLASGLGTVEFRVETALESANVRCAGRLVTSRRLHDA